MTSKFKAGDWVYYPVKGCELYKVVKVAKDDIYPVILTGATFTKDGLAYSGEKAPSIFHATEENHELLSKLYGVDFEKPPLRGSELTKKLLDSGWKCVPCYVHDGSDTSAIRDTLVRVITKVNDNNEFFTENAFGWRYAVPIDPKTGKELTQEVLDK